MMATWCESKSEESICSDRSLNDKEKAIAFVTSIEEVYRSDDKLGLDDYEDLIDEKLCLEYGSFFDVNCVA
ncbi:hypothetical protein D8674_019197 [Pyrus ussuriensis x Pyrus communis]|uniref:Uncharacterized protein n=1 Tax=Pyrus ussuriensis x Pyrus communis TaxID=2448454 RepID=A0A5N5G6W6_9ROSA|nr:hypothetical protein D8674_019197 [Pyrus ussuriensis x Pyrus communis]